MRCDQDEICKLFFNDVQARIPNIFNVRLNFTSESLYWQKNLPSASVGSKSFLTKQPQSSCNIYTKPFQSTQQQRASNTLTRGFQFTTDEDETDTTKQNEFSNNRFTQQKSTSTSTQDALQESYTQHASQYFRTSQTISKSSNGRKMLNTQSEASSKQQSFIQRRSQQQQPRLQQQINNQRQFSHQQLSNNQPQANIQRQFSNQQKPKSQRQLKSEQQSNVQQRTNNSSQISIQRQSNVHQQTNNIIDIPDSPSLDQIVPDELFLSLSNNHETSVYKMYEQFQDDDKKHETPAVSNFKLVSDDLFMTDEKSIFDSRNLDEKQSLIATQVVPEQSQNCILPEMEQLKDSSIVPQQNILPKMEHLEDSLIIPEQSKNFTLSKLESVSIEQVTDSMQSDHQVPTNHVPHYSTYGSDVWIDNRLAETAHRNFEVDVVDVPRRDGM